MTKFFQRSIHPFLSSDSIRINCSTLAISYFKISPPWIFYISPHEFKVLPCKCLLFENTLIAKHNQDYNNNNPRSIKKKKECKKNHKSETNERRNLFSSDLSGWESNVQITYHMLHNINDFLKNLELYFNERVEESVEDWKSADHFSRSLFTLLEKLYFEGDIASEDIVSRSMKLHPVTRRVTGFHLRKYSRKEARLISYTCLPRRIEIESRSVRGTRSRVNEKKRKKQNNRL